MKRFTVNKTAYAVLIKDNKTKLQVCSMCGVGRDKDKTIKMAEVMAKALNEAVGQGDNHAKQEQASLIS